MSQEKHLLNKLARDNAPQKRKNTLGAAKRIRAALFKQQRELVEDRSRFKAALCPRRAGKSYVALSMAVLKCLEKAGAKVLIIAKVRRQVKGVYWQDLKRLNKGYELGCKLRNNELNCEFPNTSQIDFTGADTAEEIDKFRGQGFDLVIIDEGKSYSPSLLRELIEEIIRPALMDRQGSMLMIGTPGAILEGIFYEVTTYGKGAGVVRPWEERKTWGRKPYLWSAHKWSSRDNVKCPVVWEEALALKEAAGWQDNHPTWIREYLGEWAPDTDAMVYSYANANKDGRCDWKPDPEEENFGLSKEHRWRFLLGMDLGWHDATALVIAAWSETHDSLFYVHAEKHPKKDIGWICDRVQQLERWVGGFDIRIADTGGLGRTIVETMARTFNVNFVAARKQDKHDHIKLLNSDLEWGRIKVDPASCLAEEWSTLQWANSDPFTTGFRKKEDPALDNHAADAALYLWRHAYHHWSRAPEVEAIPGSEEWWKQKERAEYEAFCEQRKQELSGEPLWKKYRGYSWTTKTDKTWG